MKIFAQNRFSILLNFLLIYCLLGTIIRLVLFFLSIQSIDFSLFNFSKIFGLGLIFDFGTAVFFSLVYGLYLLLIPSKFIGSVLDKSLTYFILFFTFFITVFSFLAEFPFWSEFNTRFNFIAVDYLIYTYEVIENINQSYPLPVLILSLLLLTGLFFFYFKKTQKFEFVFSDKMKLKKRIIYVLSLLTISFVYIQFITNKQAETTDNLYVNELSKNGVYSFFAAYRSNELDYETFYKKLSNKDAFAIIKKDLQQKNQALLSTDLSNLERKVINSSNENKPNVILICVESFSADFMTEFGNKDNLTPNLDKLATESLFFTNLYATVTRTIRGMEALTLSVPPTPGNSIVRRPNNDHLYSIATVLKQKNYNLNFIYGGDGYFDNMNTFFGGQGFNIVDRNRGNPLSDDVKTKRINIEDNEVTFENAWGICDEDIYNKTLKIADANYATKQPFFNFIMTTSNHKPYSFPKNSIDMPQGTRESVVKYTDYAIGKFIEKAKTKPWFKNTVFVIVADHCASSAGKWELNIDKHHIPALIYNLPTKPEKINKLVSQIDIMPTLFGYLNWNYNTSLYGKDIRLMQPNDERAFLGNYRTLGLLKNSIFTEINDRKESHQYLWKAKTKEMKALQNQNKTLLNLTIANYQTASYRFKNGKMKA
ncbi:LTA synthase family protein [Flavobacterium urocaniciphilum]|uniref:Phosphoglycerol transferase MdoB n=1 Tax=Flavobacterium urocaniciphilum TaxID=1299341 RepID=A0A1H9BSX5_9FLAO|nr:alkaline phosphatase family protein [Flavobacterium urocaniciphilum]SEP92072.1 Phosphoglycerol transferase MdoB [Flavobacterium urocaniciphilum]